MGEQFQSLVRRVVTGLIIQLEIIEKPSNMKILIVIMLMAFIAIAHAQNKAHASQPEAHADPYEAHADPYQEIIIDENGIAAYDYAYDYVDAERAHAAQPDLDLAHAANPTPFDDYDTFDTPF